MHFDLAVENRSGYDEIKAETVSKTVRSMSSVHAESHCSFSLRAINSVPFKRDELEDGK